MLGSVLAESGYHPSQYAWLLEETPEQIEGKKWLISRIEKGGLIEEKPEELRPPRFYTPFAPSWSKIMQNDIPAQDLFTKIFLSNKKTA